MSDSFLVVLVVAGGVAAFFVAVRLPRRRSTLDRAKLSKSFHGLILFGKNGAYVGLDLRSSGDRILFTKRCSEDRGWFLDVAVSGPNVSTAILDKVESDIDALGDRFEVEAGSGEDTNQLGFSLAGGGLEDPAALESVARLLTRRLGHPNNAKYRVMFDGPKDYEAVDKYFGFKR